MRRGREAAGLTEDSRAAKGSKSFVMPGLFSGGVDEPSWWHGTCEWPGSNDFSYQGEKEVDYGYWSEPKRIPQVFRGNWRAYYSGR